MRRLYFLGIYRAVHRMERRNLLLMGRSQGERWIPAIFSLHKTSTELALRYLSTMSCQQQSSTQSIPPTRYTDRTIAEKHK